MPTLHISLLGDFALATDEQAICGVNTARLQSLLAYLILHRSAAQMRRQLAFLFWPDSTESQARSNLRHLIHFLRRVLPSPADFLVVDGTTIQWKPDAAFTLDVLAFEAALATAALAQSQGDVATSRAALLDAVTLYRGELLPGCYDDWIQPERERLHQSFIEALTQLIELLTQQNDVSAAIRYAQRLLRIDPLHETTYQQLMGLYAQLGDRAHALNTYHTCVTVLQRELEVAPSAATQAVYRRLQAGAQTPTTPSPAPLVSPVRQHNLPTLLTTFIGRQAARRAIKASLTKTRLLTLTGPGGCGKTRLALAVADELVPTYANGVWLVELGALREQSHIVQRVANVLAITEEPVRPLLDTLVAQLREQQLLLIFDTCEHLIEPCVAVVQTLLLACPKLQVLATSRERLALAGEMVWPVPPLTMPPLAPVVTGPENALPPLAEYESVQLLIDRVQAVLPTFMLTAQNAAAVVQICVHLDGMPLAIELAAARAAVLSLPEIATYLDQRFQLLRQSTRDAIPRHQTLAAALDWSHDRLTADEQILFRRLAIFDSTFTLQAAQALCTPDENSVLTPELRPALVLDLVARLVDKSLINASHTPDQTTRYGMLETIHAYGYARLVAADEVLVCRRRLLTFFTALAEAAAGHLQGNTQVDWLDRLEAERENLRLAINWSLPPPCTDEELAFGLRLGGALWRFWIYRGHYRAGSEQLRDLITATAQRTLAATPLYAKVLVGAGCLAGEVGEYATAQQLLERALACYQNLNQLTGVAEATYSLAWLANWRGEPVSARRYYETSIALYGQLGDEAGLAWALRGLAWLDRITGDLAQARTRCLESLVHFRTTGDQAGLCFALGGLAYIALDQGDYVNAQQYAAESLAYARQVGDQHAVSMGLRLLGRVANKMANSAQATIFYTESLAICRAQNDKYGIAQNLHGLGEAAMLQGALTQAAQHFEEAQHFYQSIDYKPGLAWLLLSTGDLAVQTGNIGQAAHDYQAALTLSESIQQPWLTTASQQRLAQLPTP